MPAAEGGLFRGRRITQTLGETMIFFKLEQNDKSSETEQKSLRGSLINQGLMTVAVLFVLLFVLLSFGSMGWFTQGSALSAENMQVALEHKNYYLLVDRTARYDVLIEGEPVYSGVSELKTFLRDEEDFSLTESSTRSVQRLACELQNEAAVRIDGVDYYYLMPGSYGTLTFFVEPKEDEDVSVELGLELGGYVEELDEFDNVVVQEVTNPLVRRLLTGHLLFFTGRTGGTYENFQYSGLITDYSIHYSTEGKSKVPGEDYYEVTLYWEWPVTYNEIVAGMSTTDPAVTRKYPPELREYIDDNRDAFFLTNKNSNDLELLSDGYNDADQVIGTHAGFISAFVTSK